MSTISVLRLPGPVPFGPVIGAHELKQLTTMSAWLDTVRQQAAEMLAAACREAEEIREAARQAGMASAREEMTALRSSIIESAVEWLFDQRELEAVVAGRMETRLRALVAEVLEEFLGEQDPIERLMHRLRSRLATFSAGDLLTLRVAPANHAALYQAFADRQQLNVEADGSLAPGHAILDTAFARIVLDPDVHLHAVMSRLRSGDEVM